MSNAIKAFESHKKSSEIDKMNKDNNNKDYD